MICFRVTQVRKIPKIFVRNRHTLVVSYESSFFDVFNLHYFERTCICTSLKLDDTEKNRNLQSHLLIKK